MKVTKSDNGVITIELTRYNLEVLLAKLDDPASVRTIGKGGVDVPYLFVHAVENDEHYTDRPPGEMILPSGGTLPEPTLKEQP